MSEWKTGMRTLLGEMVSRKEAEAHITTLESQLAEKDKELVALNGANRLLNTDLESIRKELAESRAEVERLRDERGTVEIILGDGSTAIGAVMDDETAGIFLALGKGGGSVGVPSQIEVRTDVREHRPEIIIRSTSKASLIELKKVVGDAINNMDTLALQRDGE